MLSLRYMTLLCVLSLLINIRLFTDHYAMKENLQGTDLDKRNKQLGYMLKRLHQNIDIDRIIGLNVCTLEESSIDNPFIGYLQQQAKCFIA